jgi:DNA-binding response OmpR family regulator
VVIVAPYRSDVSEFVDALARSAYGVRLVHDPQAVARAVIGGRPDVVVVDLRHGDPLAARILNWMSANGKSRALVITEAHEVDARLSALDLGAADHLAAPFEIREAVARVERLIAQQRKPRPSCIVAGDLTLDLAQRSAVRNGRHVALTPREVSLLLALVDRSEHPVTKRELLVAVWGEEARSQNVVEANVSSLRRKLHALGPPVIHTLHGAGYVFRPVAEQSR